MQSDAGSRTRWRDLPESIHRHIAEVLGDEAMEAASQSKGFSPGSADRVRTARGRRAFVKAVSRTRNADSYELHRREAAVMKALPSSVRSPSLLGSFDDSEWVALILEDIDGRHPGPTSTEHDVLSVLASLETLPLMRNVNTVALAEAPQDLAAAARAGRGCAMTTRSDNCRNGRMITSTS